MLSVLKRRYWVSYNLKEMSTANSQIQRTKRIMKISPFNGYEFNEGPNLKYQIKDKSIAVYMPKRERPHQHNFLTNLRNTENFIKSQSDYKDKFMEDIETGKKDEGGYDEIGIIVVNRKRRLKPINRGSSLVPETKGCCQKQKSSSIPPKMQQPASKSPERKIKKSIENSIGRRCSAKKRRRKVKTVSFGKRNRSLPNANKIHKGIKNFRIYRRRPSFNSYQESKKKRLLKSETDLLMKDYLNPEKQNIRRYSNNLKGLDDFKKMPFKSVILKQNTGNLSKKAFKHLQKTNYERDTLIGYGQNIFNSDPREYIEMMR